MPGMIEITHYNARHAIDNCITGLLAAIDQWLALVGQLQQ